jgi:hypothetical protein
MRSHALVCVLSLIATAALAQPRGAGGPPVYRDRVDPHWFDNNTKLWYRNDLAGGKHEFVLVDVAAGTRKVVPEAPGGAVAGSGGEGALAPGDRPRASRRTGDSTEITFVNRTAGAVEVFWMDTEGERRKYATVAPGETWQSRTFDGHVWLVTDGDGKTLGVYEATRDPAAAFIGGAPATTSATTGRAGAFANRGRRAGSRPSGRSPDGKYVAVVREYNLYVRPSEGGEEVRLSDDGKPGDAYDGGRIFWSPDSKRIAALRTEPEQEHKVYTVESSPRDQVQPKLRSIDYLKPGDKVAHPRPQLFDVASRKHIAIKEDLFANPWSIEEIRWAADSSRFTFVYNQRGHQALRVIAVDAADGSATAIIDEHSDTFIDYSGKYFCQWVGDDEIIWMS